MPAPTHAYDSLLALRRARRDPIGFLQHLAADGDIVPFSLGEERAFLLNHPAFFQDALVTSSRKFVKPPALARATRLLGQGLLTAEGSLHDERRRTALPAFRQGRLERYGQVMIALAGEQCERWKSGTQIDIVAEMHALALRIVGETLFSTDLAVLAPELRHILDRATCALDPLVTVIAPNRTLRPAQRRLREIVDDVIARRVREVSPPEDLLTLLLRAEGPEASEEQLRDDVQTVLLAGHDTIANSLAWTIARLADHPHVSARLQAEFDTVLGKAQPSVGALEDLRYVRATFAESLRLTPPAWILARRSIAAHDFGAQHVPEGSLIVMSPYLAHRDDRFFPDPLMFNPERWLDIAPGDRLQLGFFPFGAGRRSCIGEAFAWMEGTLVLAVLAQRWRFVAVDLPRHIEPRITLRPGGPLLMRLERTEGRSATP